MSCDGLATIRMFRVGRRLLATNSTILLAASARLFLTFSICLLLPMSAEARVIIEDATSPGFPSDPAFAAGNLIIPLDRLPLRTGDQSFSITVGGVQFRFQTTAPSGLFFCFSGPGGTPICRFQTSDNGFGSPFAPIFVTMSPPVPAFGIVNVGTECGPQVTFVGSLGTESGSLRRTTPMPLFLGAADIGGISTVTLDDTCSTFASWSEIRFVPGGAGQADVAANKTSDALDGVVIGAREQLSYSIDVANLGRDTARSVTVVDFPPPGVTLNSTSAGATLEPPGRPTMITWSLGDLAPGERKSVGVLVTTPPFGAFSCEDTLLNIAQVTTSTGDTNLRNNLAFRSTRFNQASRAAEPEICGNGLDDNCNGLVDINDPACAGSASFALVATAPAPPPPGGGGGGGGGATSDPGSCELHGVSIAAHCCDPFDFLRSGCPIDPNYKESDPPANAFGYGYAQAGQTITYTIHYENIGTSDAHDVSILDPLHPNLDDTTLVINNEGVYDPATRVIVWHDPLALPAQVPRSVSFTVNVKSDAQPGTRVRNRGTVVFPDAIESPRTDTNFVEHTIVDPRFPIVADLTVPGCTETSPGSHQWRARLVNKGFGFAYNVTAEVVSAPASLRISNPLVHFVHPTDTDPTPLATVMPLSTSTSVDAVTILAVRRDNEDERDGDDAGNLDGDHRDGRRDNRRDPCDVVTWRVRFTTSTGETLSKDIHPTIAQLCPCAGPAAGGTWKNHGAYVSCVTHVAKEFVQGGLIAERQKDALVRAAAQSVCGGKTEAEQRERSDREK